MPDQPTIKISVMRESLEERIGVSLRQEEEVDENRSSSCSSSSPPRILINTITPDSLFVHTRLKPGMQVLKINNVSLVEDETMDLRKAMQILKESLDLMILEVREIEMEESPSSSIPQDSTDSNPATVTPPSSPPPPSSQQSLASTDTAEQTHAETEAANEEVRVTTLRNHRHDPNDERPTAIASTTQDPSGNDNGNSSTNLPVASAELLEEEASNADETITNNNTPDYIDASNDCIATPLTHATTVSRILQNIIDENGIVTVTATRPVHSAIGISLKKQTPKTPTGAYISNFKTFSIFIGTHLQPGMKILSVNGHDCTTAEQAVQIMKLAQGEITLVARHVSNHITRDELTSTDGLAKATVSVTKPHPRAKAGLSLRQEGNGDITIASLHPDSLFAGSNLKAGMKLLTINGVEVTNKPVKDCGLILRGIATGVTLVAREYGEVDERNSNNEDSDNEEVQQDANEGEHETTRAESRMASPTDSQELSAHEDVPTNDDEGTQPTNEPLENHADDRKEKISIDKSTEKKESIEDTASDGTKSSQELSPTEDETSSNEAKPEDDINPSSPVASMGTAPRNALSLGYSLAAAFIFKPEPSSDLGIVIHEKTLLDGSKIPVIVEIDPDGLCADTELELGMRVLSVDGVGCRGAEDATRMLSEAEGDTVTILASLSWHMAFATAIKPTKDTKVGIHMRRIGNFVVIKRLLPDGLFAKTGLLKEGMRVCCINGTDVDGLKEAQIGDLVASAEGTVTVLAENLNHCLAD